MSAAGTSRLLALLMAVACCSLGCTATAAPPASPAPTSTPAVATVPLPAAPIALAAELTVTAIAQRVERSLTATAQPAVPMAPPVGLPTATAVPLRPEMLVPRGQPAFTAGLSIRVIGFEPPAPGHRAAVVTVLLRPESADPREGGSGLRRIWADDFKLLSGTGFVFTAREAGCGGSAPGWEIDLTVAPEATAELCFQVPAGENAFLLVFDPADRAPVERRYFAL